MTRQAVVWIRHGTSVDGLERPTAHAHPGTRLSDLGRTEAHRAAARLTELGAGRVLSSPLPRAWETARILAAELGIPLEEPYPQLREWQAPDCVLGVTPAGYPPQYLRWRRIRAAEPDTALPGGESLAAFARRALDAAKLVEDIAARSRRPVLVVAHVLLALSSERLPNKKTIDTQARIAAASAAPSAADQRATPPDSPQ